MMRGPLLLYALYIYILNHLGFSSEIVTGTVVPLETRKSSIMVNSFSSFWEYESTCKYAVNLNLSDNPYINYN